jgi:hypothetical protein
MTKFKGEPEMAKYKLFLGVRVMHSIFHARLKGVETGQS